MFCIAICEDNENEAELILRHLSKLQDTHYDIKFYIKSFNSGEMLLNDIAEGKSYDLFLLDVLMPKITGIELAKKLRNKNPDVPIVFLTSSADYALPAYKVSAVQYILKPIEEDELFSVFERILTFRKIEKNKFFMFTTLERTLKISYSAMVYVEIIGHIMRVCLDNGDMLYSKSIKVSFRSAIASLLEDDCFLYAHKSYLINMDHVQELCGKTFIMTGGHVIPVPKYKIADAKEKYFAYLSRCGIGCLGGK